MPTPDLEDLLERTSRTFALSIPLLEEPVRRQVTLAYLLFRIADTFEDAAAWPPARRVAALQSFGGWLETEPDEETVAAAIEEWLETPPSDHDGYIDLLRATGEVLRAARDLDPQARASVAQHTRRTCDGMARFVRRASADGELELDSLEELKAYCYVVAGIVGEMLTELFLLDAPGLGSIAPALRARAATFGEALQLVNIVKDASADVVEGRSFLPESVPLQSVFDLARGDLEVASEYVLLLQEHGAPRGQVAFTALPVQLAWAALREVEARGSGAKVGRAEVLEIAQQLQADLEAGRPAVPTPDDEGTPSADP